jgi:hypothetical protein
MSGRGILATLLVGAGLLEPGVAQAVDVNGAWAVPADQCNKIYTWKGKQLVFSTKADLYGSGFVIDNNTIRGKIARCTIKSRKDDGQEVHFIAACSTDIAVEILRSRRCNSRYELSKKI